MRSPRYGASSGVIRCTGRFLSGLVVIGFLACTRSERDDGSASAARESTNASMDSIATPRVKTDSRLDIPTFCATRPESASYNFRSIAMESTTGDLSGYYVRVERVSGRSWSILATEAIGSFGDLLPVRDLVTSAADSQVVEFTLPGPTENSSGPSLQLRFSCDSAWGIATGPYRGATHMEVVLKRVFVGPDVRPDEQ